MILWVGGGYRATGSPERAAHQVTTIVVARYSHIQVHTKYIKTIYTLTHRCTQYILTYTCAYNIYSHIQVHKVYNIITHTAKLI